MTSTASLAASAPGSAGRIPQETPTPCIGTMPSSSQDSISTLLAKTAKSAVRSLVRIEHFDVSYVELSINFRIKNVSLDALGMQ